MDRSSRGKSSYPPRVLKYRKQVKFTETVGKNLLIFNVTILGLTVLLLMIAFIISLFMSETFPVAPIITFLFFIFVVIIVPQYLLHHYFIKPLANSKIQVYADKIFIKRGKKDITIPFDDIAKIKNNRMGWLVLILKNKKKYRFTVALERSDYIIDAIYKYNPKLLSEDEYIKLRRLLVISDHDLGRIYDLFSKRYRLVTVFHICILPLSFVIALYLKQSNEFVINSSFGYFWDAGKLLTALIAISFIVFQSIVNKIVNKHTLKKIEDLAVDKTRDIKLEFKVYKRAYSGYLAVLLLCLVGFYQTDINTLGTVSLSVNSEYLDIKASERLWYDARYNCTNCNFSLKEGDLVVTNRRNVYKVFGLPNRLVSVNQKNKKGRYIASKEEKQVPENHLAIMSSNGEVVKLIPNKLIKGKIFKEIPHF